MESYKIRLPDGTNVTREMSKEEAEYWLSIGLYLAHGFHHITAIFAAEQENEETDDDIIEIDDAPEVDEGEAPQEPTLQ